jgi:hypothetical protein
MSASSDEGDDATDGGTYQHARPFGKDTGSLLRHPPQRQERRNASPTTAIVGHQHAQDRRHIARLGLPTTPGRMSRDGPRCRSQAGRGTDGRVLLEVGIKRGVSTWRTLKGLHQRLLPPLQAVLRSAHTPSVRVHSSQETIDVCCPCRTAWSWAALCSSASLRKTRVPSGSSAMWIDVSACLHPPFALLHPPTFGKLPAIGTQHDHIEPRHEAAARPHRCQAGGAEGRCATVSHQPQVRVPPCKPRAVVVQA